MVFYSEALRLLLDCRLDSNPSVSSVMEREEFWGHQDKSERIGGDRACR